LGARRAVHRTSLSRALPHASGRVPAGDRPAGSSSKVDIAEALGISRQSLYDIMAEKQPVTPGMAVRLGAVFGTSSASWLKMQVAYDLWHAEREIDVSKLRSLQETG
jgi:addiction module HigA family antidote